MTWNLCKRAVASPLLLSEEYGSKPLLSLSFLRFLFSSNVILSPPRLRHTERQRWTTLGWERRINSLSIFTYIFVYICGCTFKVTCACVYERAYIDPRKKDDGLELFLTKTKSYFLEIWCELTDLCKRSYCRKHLLSCSGGRVRKMAESQFPNEDAL